MKNEKKEKLGMIKTFFFLGANKRIEFSWNDFGSSF